MAQLRKEVEAKRGQRDATRAKLREQNAKFEGFVDELTQVSEAKRRRTWGVTNLESALMVMRIGQELLPITLKNTYRFKTLPESGGSSLGFEPLKWITNP